MISRRCVKGFFVVWWRVYHMHQDSHWKRWYWATRTWHNLGRGKSFVS